jgi:hypothetical protein
MTPEKSQGPVIGLESQHHDGPPTGPRSDALLLQWLSTRVGLEPIREWQQLPYVELSEHAIRCALGDDYNSAEWLMHMPLPHGELELPWSEFIMTMPATVWQQPLVDFAVRLTPFPP